MRINFKSIFKQKKEIKTGGCLIKIKKKTFQVLKFR
jgi:hypothetical protein